MQPSTDTTLERDTLGLYEAGRYLDAYEGVERAGGLDALTGPSGRALAGRLVNNLGAGRYGSAIHLRAWRQTPDASALAYFAGMAYSQLWGPIRALGLLDAAADQPLTDYGVSDVQSGRAYQFAALRDFSRAETALAVGFEAAPDRAWLLVTKGHLLSMQDRPLEGITALREALERRPLYRPAVQSLAASLIQQNQIDEARTLLIQAGEQMQSGAIWLQLAQLEREMRMYESAQQRMEAALPLLPLRNRDRDSAGDYAGFAATLAYDVGDIDGAIRLGEESGRPFHKAVSENLRNHRDAGRRVVLDVGFTLQEEVTCVPATISTLTAFWGEPVPQPEIAEAICYDGTPAHGERAWLEERGLFCREFTLTWETALELIDAGLPFSQTLAGYTMGHMQAVIGYDSRRGVLIYRDPNMRHSGEVLGKELIEQMRSTGPRGMVFVPSDQRHRVEAIDLPDHELWTQSHAVSLGLANHRRDEAVRAYKRMHAAAPEHRLTRHARGRIASYDGDLRALQKITDRLLDEFPNDQSQWGVKVRLMRQLGSRADRLAVLDSLCDKSDVEVVYRHQLIEELLVDPRERPRVDYLLRRCLRSNPVDGQTMSLLARRAWTANDDEGALLWSRYAACVDLRSEERCSTYFAAACVTGRSDEALAMLRDRFERFAKNDSGPAIGLIDALDQVLQQEEALRVLQAAVRARPDDGALRLYACDYLTRVGRHDQAEKQLGKACGQSHEGSWRSTAARVAHQKNRFDEAYGHLSQALKRAPLSVGLHRHAAQVLADGRGAAAAIEHLKRYVERFPKSIDLRAALVEFASELGPEQAEREAREHVRLHPEDAWCWRELGFKLVEQRRWREAREAAAEAERHDPGSMQNRLLRAQIDVGVGDEADARAELLAAIRTSVDYVAAMIELFRLCQTRQERREAVASVLVEMKRQVVQGGSLHLLQSQAARSYEPDEALKIVEEARSARPDLPQTWSVVVEQLLAMKKTQDALDVARSAVKRFPLVTSVHLDLANVYHEMGDDGANVKQLKRALAIDSRLGETLRSLAEAYARTGDERRQRAMLERACESEPRNVTHRGALAEFFWLRGERDTAIDAIRAAIKQEPHYEWGWSQLTEWAFVVGQPDLLVEMARSIAESRPNSPAAWLQKSELLGRFPEHAGERLEAIEKALALDPRSVDAHEQHAVFLTDHGRFDEAIAACAPTAFSERQPLRLRARAAVVESERGELGAAIAAMRGVVEADPHYAWAWSQLASWLQQADEPAEALDAAKRLIDLAPRAPASWGYVAECLTSQGDLDGAKEHLKRSIELDSSYLYGGNALLAMQVEAAEHDAAFETLATIGPHLADHDRAAHEARIAALAGLRDRAHDAMTTAVRTPAETDELLRDAMDAMLLAGWAESLQQLLDGEVREERATPQAVSGLVELLVREGRVSETEALCDRLDLGTPRGVEAAVAYLDALGSAGAGGRLDAFVYPRSAALRAPARTWGLVGSALQRGRRYREAVAWMHDWRSRADAQPHQLASLALALLHLGETERIPSIVDHALAMPIAPATDTLRVIAASAAAFNGDAATVADRLDPVAPQALSPYYGELYRLQRVASHAALSIDAGGSGREAWAAWRRVAAPHDKSTGDELFEALLAHSRLLLIRRRGNPLRKWRATRHANRLRSLVVAKARSPSSI